MCSIFVLSILVWVIIVFIDGEAVFSDQRQQRGLRHSSDLLKIIASCVSLDCDALEDPAARECAAEEYRTRGQQISQSESSLHRLLHPWFALTGLPGFRWREFRHLQREVAWVLWLWKDSDTGLCNSSLRKLCAPTWQLGPNVFSIQALG